MIIDLMKMERCFKMNKDIMVGRWDNKKYIIKITKREENEIRCFVLKEIGNATIKWLEDTKDGLKRKKEYCYILEFNRKDRELIKPTDKQRKWGEKEWEKIEQEMIEKEI